MVDIVDEAGEREEELRAKALAVRKPTGPVPCGRCYHCDAEVERQRRWCDDECKADWARLQIVQSDRGGRYYDYDNE